MGIVKYDHEPLLAPGRHYLTVHAIGRICVEQFDGAARQRREQLFYGFESFLQTLLVAQIRCDVFVDGSFLTRKPNPDDVDVFVATEHAVHEALSDAQKDLLDSINTTSSFEGVQGIAMITYPRDHPFHGMALDGGNPCEAFGLEHGQFWLKGVAVVRVWETDVRNRICR
jgi:hypothetical protein